MKALCTGGGGFLGSHVVDFLIEKGIETHVLVSGFRSKNHPNIVNKDAIVHRGDIRSLSDLDAATKNVDYVFHLAAILSHYCDVYPDLTIDVNVKGTWNLRQACLKNRVQRIIFASSSYVYGEQSNQSISENVDCQPKDIFGVSKLAGEKILQAMYPVRIPYTILRLFNIYGPRSYPDKFYSQAIATFILNALQGKSIEIHDDGTQALDFIFVKDAASVFLSSLNPNAANQVFNVGSGKAESINNIVSQINQLTSNPSKPHYNPAHPAYFSNVQADITKIKECLEWTPKVNFAEGLKETIKFFRENSQYAQEEKVS